MKTRLEKSKHQKKQEKETGRQKLKRLRKGKCIWDSSIKGTYSPHSEKETRRNKVCDTDNRKFNLKKKEKKNE